MDEAGKTFAPELTPAESGKWIGRLVIAVVLGAAIWNFVAAITENLILPAFAKLVDVDPQSPLYLGKGNIGAPALFTAVVEVCLAGIAAAFISSWIRRPTRKVRIVGRSTAIPSIAPVLSRPAPAAEAPSQPATPEPRIPTAQPAPARLEPPLAAAPPAASEKPSKPKPPKEVYYNLVGERIDSDED